MIRVNDLNFTYPGNSEPTIDHVAFSLEAGRIYGFLGPSGAGKSTTQRILYGLLPRYQGSVQVYDREIRDWSTAIYARVGIAFETPNLYLKLTGRENLDLARALRSAGGARTHSSGTAVRPEDRRIEAGLERLGLTDAANQRVEKWSKGMRMRLSFLRAVLHAPDLLFLDEPTSGLDPMWARVVKDWVLELRQEGTAVFLTTHSMELADELCDTVGFLIDGRIAAEDSPTVLKQRHGSPAITVYGRDAQDRDIEQTVPYDELRCGPLSGISHITRVVNREVSLEEVFLQLTGRTLTGQSLTGQSRLDEGDAGSVDTP